MKSLLIIIGCMLPFAGASAATLNLKATCSVSGEYVEIDADEVKSNGWVETEDEYGDIAYTLDVSLDAAQLPLNKSLGDAYLSVSKTGKLEMGMSVGDSDASADSSLQLPLKSGEIAPIDTLTWTASGGDHASGMWSFNCTTEISIK